jgi:hypothetical protein
MVSEFLISDSLGWMSLPHWHATALAAQLLQVAMGKDRMLHASVLNNNLPREMLVPSARPLLRAMPSSVVSVEYRSTRVGRDGGERSDKRLRSGTVDALGRRRFERMTLGVEHI